MPLVVPAPGVLGNDSDVDLPPDPLAAVLETEPAVGSLDLRDDGLLVYTPTADYCGVVTFTYRVSDGLAFSSAAMVTITMTPVCDYGVQLDPPNAAKVGDAGTTVTYSLRLTNSSECNDIFNVSVAATWLTKVSPIRGPLAPGMGTNVVVSVTIPVDVRADDQDIATVTLVSQGNDNVTAATWLMTTAVTTQTRVYLPVLVGHLSYLWPFLGR